MSDSKIYSQSEVDALHPEGVYEHYIFDYSDMRGLDLSGLNFENSSLTLRSKG